MLLAAGAGAAEGDWLLAARQSAGRGRLGRAWQSPPGNVYTSGLVRLRAGDPPAPTLALVAAIAVFDVVARWTGAGLQLKWPNDLLVGDAKIAGILLERAGDAVVIGIGVNLAHHPVGLARPTTSLAALGIAAPDPSGFVETMADIFARWLSVWRTSLGTIQGAWTERAHPVGTALSVSLPDGVSIVGTFDGLSADCALRLRLADGTARVIHAGDVFLI